MKKYLFLLLLTLVACEPPKDRYGVPIQDTARDISVNRKQMDYCRGPNSIYEVRIEDCQYIVFSSSEAGYISHKGNCDNPIHCHNQKDSL
jgi:hypothetical protein